MARMIELACRPPCKSPSGSARRDVNPAAQCYFRYFFEFSERTFLETLPYLNWFRSSLLLLFLLFDLPIQLPTSFGGLTQVQGLCRSREASALGHLDECLELIETNAAHDHKIRLSIPSK
jgi:hypothetical protein